VRWRFADRITAFEPWARVAGRKAVSLEEYKLLEPLGREGILPESLVLECCVEHVRWLVAASSGFRQTCVLEEVEEFKFAGEAGMGAVLEVEAELSETRRDGPIEAACRITCSGRALAVGRLRVGLVPLAEGFDPELTESLWRELHGAT